MHSQRNSRPLLPAGPRLVTIQPRGALPVHLESTEINMYQTDGTRARAQELHIQQRVQAELAKIRDQEGARLTELLSALTPDDSNEDKPSALSSGEGVQRTHDSVKKEIAALKQKLDSRRKMEEPSGEVTKAKEDLVQCLRNNDRRPLDCWMEVEGFKREVARLERGFVERTMR